MIRSLPVIPNDPRKARILFLHFWGKGPAEALATFLEHIDSDEVSRRYRAVDRK